MHGRSDVTGRLNVPSGRAPSRVHGDGDLENSEGHSLVAIAGSQAISGPSPRTQDCVRKLPELRRRRRPLHARLGSRAEAHVLQLMSVSPDPGSLRGGP